MTNEVKLNLPLEVAIARIAKERRGKRLKLRVVLDAKPAIHTDWVRQDLRLTGYVTVSFKDLKFALETIFERQYESPALVQIILDGNYIWVG